MITTLLFDLDHTLLDNQNGTFLPAYFRLFGARFAPLAPPEKLIPPLLFATRAMLANTDPARALRAVFDDHFYAPLGLDRDRAAGALDEFYRTKFHTLRSLTGRRPRARAVMEWAFAAGLQVGIATNSVYPLVAVEERLRWAGVGNTDVAYALVASCETMRFAKPRPEFYAVGGETGEAPRRGAHDRRRLAERHCARHRRRHAHLLDRCAERAPNDRWLAA